MSTHCILFVTVAPALSELVVDWLLDEMPGQGFTSVPVHGHGENQAHYTLSEQIAGRVRRVQFQIMLEDRGAADALLAGLGRAFPDAGMRWWLLAAADSGVVGGPAPDA